MSDNDIAIEVKNISKDFILPHKDRRTLKSFFLNPFRKVKNERQHALDNVSFEIKKGEFYGIVGRNGSGKSTLLKCIAGVYHPTKGHIKVNGSLVPFIELGVGFNPDLSGRDNVYLNGSLLGFSRQEMDEMYDEIVEFSELERFIDQKLKNYSSGMQVRLAFSIAIRAKGDILLLDEVLAVGDASFKRKCYDYFKDLKKNNKTVILVSHDMQTIEEYCDKALFIDEGKLVSIDKPFEIAKLYSMENLRTKSQIVQRTNHGIIAVKSVETKNDAGVKTHKFYTTDKFINLMVEIKSEEKIKSPTVGLIIKNKQDIPIVAFNTKDLSLELGDTDKKNSIVLKVKIQNIFNDGLYYLQANIRSNDRKTIFNMQDKLIEFGVTGRKNIFGLTHPDLKCEILKK